MIDLKPYHDAVIANDVALKEIANNIDVLFRSETDEGKRQALDLQPSLEQAQQKYDDSLKLYNSLKAAASPNTVAANFVPVSDKTGDEEELKGEMERSAFQALNPAARVDFLKAGGKVVDAQK